MKKKITGVFAALVILVTAFASCAYAGEWQDSPQGWWYLNDNNTFPADTWQSIDGSWYHFNPEGYMDTGWIFSDGSWYYCHENGSMATGWLEYDGFWYYLMPNGAMAKGWELIDGTWYYFRPDGVAFSYVNFGDEGNAVWYMQNQLARLGYLNSAPDGRYGNSTYAAVLAFKSAHGDSDPNGSVDGAWLEQMCSSNTYFTPVNEYSSYSRIVAVQLALVNYGMLNTADGLYGGQTRQAVCEIQRIYGLGVTGECNMATLECIFNLGSLGYPGNEIQWYSSYTNWLIYVNTTTNILYVYHWEYGRWELLYSWRVSTGAPESPTVLGEFTVESKGYSFGHGYTCYYYTGFYGEYLMHSTLFWEDTFIPMNPTLGENISAGCVRMSLENAKWIYENIPYGTKVVVVR